MKILHITPWYPNKENSFEGIWIKRLIASLRTEDNLVYHISVRSSRTLNIRNWSENGVRHCLWDLPTERWIIIELVNFLILLYYFRVKRIHKNCDIINFHIAYPQLSFWSILKASVKKPVTVFEHWSAYHFNFGVKKELPRIQRIFKSGIPLITVSHALSEDIKVFSKLSFLETYVVPNVVNIETYQLMEGSRQNHRIFFMLSQWKWPKKPHLIIKAFAELVTTENYRNCLLRIGGYGPQVEEMILLTRTLGITSFVTFLGALQPETIAKELNSCAAFLHCSEYETFSVVCAEALCCGTPVIASNVGAIPELVHENNVLLVSKNTVSEWLSALKRFNPRNFNRSNISLSASNRFSPARIGVVYSNVLNSVCEAGK